MIDKELALDVIKLLSAMESWGFAAKEVIPDYLQEGLLRVVDRLTKEVLK